MKKNDNVPLPAAFSAARRKDAETGKRFFQEIQRVLDKKSEMVYAHAK
jgi:hypothetical protein